jgi:hypothetical protein
MNQPFKLSKSDATFQLFLAMMKEFICDISNLAEGYLLNTIYYLQSKLQIRNNETKQQLKFQSNFHNILIFFKNSKGINNTKLILTVCPKRIHIRLELLSRIEVEAKGVKTMAGWFIKLHKAQSHPLADTLFHFGQTTPKQTIKLRNQHLYERTFQCQNQIKLTVELRSISQ